MEHLLDTAQIEAFGLYLIRTSATLLAAPLIGTGSSFSGYKVALVVSVSAVLFTYMGSPLEASVGPFEYAILGLREVLVGVFLAFTLHAARLAVAVAGKLVGQDMGLNMSNQADPVTGINVPLVSRLYEAFFFLALLAANGHHWLIRALESSFRRAPVGHMEFKMETVELAIVLMRETFTAGIAFAAPITVLLGLVSLLMGLLARMVPQLNVLEVSFTMRISVGLLGLFIFLPLLAPGLDHVLAEFQRGLGVALDLLGS